ncbi:tape measure protein [Alsobacter sp. R-9]
MAGDTEQLVVSLEARITQFEKAFARANATASRNWTAIERRGQQAARNLERSFARAGNGVSAQISRMASTSAAALGAALSVSQIAKMADVYTNLSNKLAAAGETMGSVSARQEELVQIALRSRSSLESVGDLYTSLRRSTADLGANQAQVSRVTETISKAFALSGASAATASGAITQLGQAFASGVLRGDELNSVLEGAPPLARLIAREFGVSVGELKRLGEEGKLSADRVFQALLNGSKEIETQFAATTSTISQAFTNLETAMTAWLGKADQANGASAKIAGGINALAGAMETVAPIAFSLGAALLALPLGPIAAGLAGAATASYLFSDSIRPIAGELATLGDYARVAFDLVSMLSVDAANALVESFRQASELVVSALNAIGAPEAFTALLAAVKTTVNGVIGAFAMAAKTIIATWSTLGGAIAESIVGAMNAVIATIEGAINRIVGGVNSVLGSINAGGAKVGVDLGLSNISNVSLGRVANSYAGAGKVAGDAFGDAFAALSKDYVGDALGAVSDKVKEVGDKIRSDANALADNRAEIERRRQQNLAGKGGSLLQPLKAPGAGVAAGGGGGGGASENGFDKTVAQIEQQIAAYERQRQTLGMTNAEALRFETTAKLLNAAQQAGISINDELRAKVDQLATSYANAATKLEEAERAQQEFRSAAQSLGSSLASGLTDAIFEGKKLSEVFKDLAKQIANMLIQKAIFSLIGGFGFADGGPVRGFATGGYVSGPGTSTSDSIPALLSDGEFVMNASATRRYGPLLAALNSGKALRLADGGPVGPMPLPSTSGKAGASQVITLAPTVNVNATGGKPEENRDLAAKIGGEVQRQLRGLIATELRQQLRPGGILNR